MNRNYRRFLNSPEWKLISTARKNMDGNKCTRCGATDHLEAHHLTYEPDLLRGILVLDNLVTLCRSCHDATHGYSYGRIDLDEMSYCRNCAWMNDNTGRLLCLRKESQKFCQEVGRTENCEWYWPWMNVKEADRVGHWDAEKVFNYMATKEEG